jgi:hypothetical protein
VKNLATSYSPEQWALSFTTALGAIGAFITLIIGLKKGNAKIESVHTLVNDRSEKQDDRVEQLAGALSNASVTVPPSPPKETT